MVAILILSELLLQASWFTARMICTVSYKAIDRYRKHRKAAIDGKMEPVYDAAIDPPVPWVPSEPVYATRVESVEEERTRLHHLDREWIESLNKATEARVANDNRRILEELHVLSDRVDNLDVKDAYRKLQCAMMLLLEYQQNPTFRTAYDTLQQAEHAAREVYTFDKSLVLSLNALRIRIVITYLHVSRESLDVDPTIGDKAADKRQCNLYLSNSLKQGPVKDLSRRFLATREDRGREAGRRVEEEAIAAFNIILEIIASVHLLEPYNPDESLIPEKTPDIVKHALAEYCMRNLGNTSCYREASQAFIDWQNTSCNQERLVLHEFFRSTNGEGWACKNGWDNLFESDLSSLYGVTVDKGSVTKLSLGCNNLTGTLPPNLAKLTYLTELALPGNNLSGEIPHAIWEIPRLQVVALQGNSYDFCPPGDFVPAAQQGEISSGQADQMPDIQPRQRRGLAATVEPCHAHRMNVYKEEWFTCSWKITNIGSRPFSSGTRLVKEDSDRSHIKGSYVVMINVLRPGEEQTVHVMQQAPRHENYYQDEWHLAGTGLDFVDDDDAKTTSPLIKVAVRDLNSVKRSPEHQGNEEPSLNKNVFIVERRHRPQPAYRMSSRRGFN